MKVKSAVDSLMQDVEHAIANVARWPDSQANKDEALETINKLRKAFDAGGLSDVVRHACILRIVGGMFSEVSVRDKTPRAGLAMAWAMMTKLMED